MAIGKNALKLCREDVSLIENYDKAMADNEHIWVCHHRDEIKTLPSGRTVIRSPEELKENGRYYNCPANELIFMTMNEHNALHAANRSEESLKKLSESTAKNHSHYWKGKKMTIEHRAKLAANRRRRNFTGFAKKFFEHFGKVYADDPKFYHKESNWYHKHNKICRWEVEDAR